MKAGISPCLPSGSEQEIQTGHTSQSRLRGSTHSIFFTQVLYFLLPTSLFLLLLVGWDLQWINSGVSDKENLSLWRRIQEGPWWCHLLIPQGIPVPFPWERGTPAALASPSLCRHFQAQGLFISIPELLEEYFDFPGWCKPKVGSGFGDRRMLRAKGRLKILPFKDSFCLNWTDTGSCPHDFFPKGFYSYGAFLASARTGVEDKDVPKRMRNGIECPTRVFFLPAEVSKLCCSLSLSGEKALTLTTVV